jgi:hypothetical protein
MKKILTLTAIVAGFAFGANAQMRECDLRVELASPMMPNEETPYTLNCNSTDSFTEQYFIINDGPDMVLPEDTILLGSPLTTGYNYFYANTGDTLLMGDTLNFVRRIAATQIKWLTAPDEDNVLQEVLRSALVSGNNYVWINSIQLSGYSAVNANSEDPDASNDNGQTIVKWNCSATGINGLAKNNGTLKVFPNPANNQISFTNDFTTTTTASVRITDIAGRVVKSMDLGKQNAGAKTYNVDIADLNNGMYYIELVTEATRSISKFIKN